LTFMKTYYLKDKNAKNKKKIEG
ncbi:replication protein, partial [Salmonella enterica subsp. enterica serovar Anatum]|nr:replication protein [Salmonella enterica]ECT2913822.1 replication protein [Salmonella enterica subsp. enterica serovar Eko]ECV5484694.1 replication protein [Salmonella enterica subsp. enterica serovar Anatum]ECJ8195458.1 replication protein [Salmonella enterica]EEJ0558313.1 replication protein [Salmonella enterica subsp. enterica serovar Anatum]